MEITEFQQWADDKGFINPVVDLDGRLRTFISPTGTVIEVLTDDDGHIVEVLPKQLEVTTGVEGLAIAE